ncbi:MAG: DUF72 domain-containing protein [Ferruginibacter sp.]
MGVRRGKFYSGISGLVMPGPRSTYPPDFRDKSRLEYYASLFNSLEINSSFYKTPKETTVIKWAVAVPEQFKFTFKLSKAITHVKWLDYNEDDVEPFMKTIGYAGQKKGCLLIQFPPSLKIDRLDRLQKLLSDIVWNNEDQWQLAVEFRHASWYEKEVYEILEEYKAIPVLQDIPASATPVHEITSDFIYRRFHGPDGRYRGSYSDEFLKEHAEQIRDWLSGGKDVYCYFNNTMGDAVKNLLTLQEFVGLTTIELADK